MFDEVTCYDEVVAKLASTHVVFEAEDVPVDAAESVGDIGEHAFVLAEAVGVVGLKVELSFVQVSFEKGDFYYRYIE